MTYTLEITTDSRETFTMDITGADLTVFITGVEAVLDEGVEEVALDAGQGNFLCLRETEPA